MKSNFDVFTVVSSSPDGTSLEVMDRRELEKRIAQGYYGTSSRETMGEDATQFRSLDKGDQVDLRAIGGVWIIPGRPVAPTPREKVVEWDLP